MIIGLYLLSVVITILFVYRNELFAINKRYTPLNEDSYCKVVKVFSNIDEGIIISMLKSAEIDSKSDSTHFQRVQFGNLTSCLYGINIFVNKEYLQEAKSIVIAYISTKKNILVNDKDCRKRALSILFFEPPLYKQLPELLV